MAQPTMIAAATMPRPYPLKENLPIHTASATAMNNRANGLAAIHSNNDFMSASWFGTANYRSDGEDFFPRLPRDSGLSSFNPSEASKPWISFTSSLRMNTMVSASITCPGTMIGNPGGYGMTKF